VNRKCRPHLLAAEVELGALTRALDRLDVMRPAPTIRAEPAATWCEMVEEVGHRVVRTMRGDEVVARKRGPLITLAARDKYDLALFVGD
jgi:hypothetical protein